MIFISIRVPPRKQPKRKTTRVLEKARKALKPIASLRAKFPKRKVVTPQNPLRICFVCGAGTERSRKISRDFSAHIRERGKEKFFSIEGTAGIISYSRDPNRKEELRRRKSVVENSDVIVSLFEINSKKYNFKTGMVKEGFGRWRPATEEELLLAREIKEGKKHFIYLDPIRDLNRSSEIIWDALRWGYVFRG